MTNIIAFRPPKSSATLTDKVGALATCFARARRSESDVFWLKENAELLNVMETSGLRPDLSALEPLQPVYQSILDRISFFPQYYRFFLSIGLDLEDLGIAGTAGERMAEWTCTQGLAEGELSDLQRLEAARLVARRGFDAFAHDPGLADRVRRFVSRSQLFALPNKKAAYELTHAVFYLSEYGRKDPELAEGTHQSLHFAGILALLDQNTDLLAEICIAMRFAGMDVPEYWETSVLRVLDGYEIIAGEQATVNDDYHCYLMVNWLEAVRGGEAFDADFAPQRMGFYLDDTRPSALRGLSQTLLHADGQTRGSWKSMQAEVEKTLELPALSVINAAEGSSPYFEEFFERFARTARV
ncbi:DUF6902 family protein [Poseidonocella sedimentorum]|uniref:Uncharacterized protein n=1 Tax=Poseidonocella sedimentorum TaxID=871652 RepID=A0A1I6DFP9_9RHOB|nr:hypothetical protein [Poseidonocella sedimentorum]SFR04275.1 hypothetical protein SAMN04515673_103147 [Poseidonocella sedimentorum]